MSFSSTQPLQGKGFVYIVGAGPGDPGLLTVKGLRCLQKADVVIVDELVDPRILMYAPKTTKVVWVSSHKTNAGNPSTHPGDRRRVIELMIREASRGLRVVRLKGGCGTIFARLNEELRALQHEGIPYEVIPGVTAAVSAAANGKISLTDCHFSSAVAFFTGHQRAHTKDLPLHYEKLAQFPGTIVVYMGVSTVEQWTGALLRGGMSPETPAAIVRRCSWPDQQAFRCHLRDLPQVIHRHQIRPPVVVILGRAVLEAPESAWTKHGPLKGKRILIVEPELTPPELWYELYDRGADVCCTSCLEAAPVGRPSHVDEIAEGVKTYECLVFSSVYAVKYLFAQLFERNQDIRALGKARLAAIGLATAVEMRKYHLVADFVLDDWDKPAHEYQKFCGERLGEFTPRALLLREEPASLPLRHYLETSGFVVDETEVCRVSPLQDLPLSAPEPLQAGTFQWAIIPDPASARICAELLPTVLGSTWLITPDRITAQTLQKLGYDAVTSISAWDTTAITDFLVAATCPHEQSWEITKEPEPS